MSQLHQRAVLTTKKLPEIPEGSSVIQIDRHHIYGYHCTCGPVDSGCHCTICGKRFGDKRDNFVCRRNGGGWGTDGEKELICNACFDEHAVMCALAG